jgi:Ni/Co efflux regulator RcnB
MKRLIFSLAVAAAVAGPLAASPAEAQGRWSREERWERREERWERGDHRGDRRGDWDGRGWERNRRYGPPQAYYPDRPGYTAWRRGGRLPPSYRGYAVDDYPRYRLRPPPRGYIWYHVDNNYLLAAPSGVIFDIIPE